MTTFSATLLGGSATDQQFVLTAFTEAAKLLDRVIDSRATFEFELHLGPLPGGIIAQTYPGCYWYDNPGDPLVPGPTYEARTGIDPNGTDPDGVISVDVQKLVLSSNPILDLAHELIHAFTFDGGGVGSARETLFDADTSGYAFVGDLAMRVYGGPVPLSVDKHHVMIAGDLMYPYDGNLSGVSPLDIAVMADGTVPVYAMPLAAAPDAVVLPAQADVPAAVWMA